MCFFLCCTEAAWVTQVLWGGGGSVGGGTWQNVTNLRHGPQKVDGRQSCSYSVILHFQKGIFYLWTKVEYFSSVLVLMWTVCGLSADSFTHCLDICNWNCSFNPRQTCSTSLLKHVHASLVETEPFSPPWGFCLFFCCHLCYIELNYILNKDQLLMWQINVALLALNIVKVKAKKNSSKHAWFR